MRPVLPLLAAAVALGTAACSGGDAAAAASSGSSASGTVVVSTADGDVEVPLHPARVAALDNTSFATVKAMGITPVAVPKDLLPATGFEDWAADDSIADIGTHRDPDLEALNAAEPDLIIGGYRFTDYTDQLEQIGTTIDISPSEDADGGYVASLEAQTRTLGEIFGAEDTAEDLVAQLEQAVDAAVAATGDQTVFLAVENGGSIDDGSSRLSRLLQPLQLQDVLGDADDDPQSVHSDSGLSPETIAQLDPDWMILLNRDAAIDAEGTETSQQLISEQTAWADTTFVTKDQIIYLPSDFYVTEGIQAYTDAFQQIADAFAAAS